MQNEQSSPEQRWKALGQRIGVNAQGKDWNSTFDELKTRYEEKGRYYHTLYGHIMDGLDELPKALSIAKDPISIETAFWFHDVIYDVKSKENEEKSGEFAQTHLIRAGAERAFAQNINRMIISTKHNSEPEDIDTKILLDMDLASLASPREKFMQNTVNIRKEYSIFSDADFNKGNSALFMALLSRPHIYLTEPFRKAYEALARANLEDLIASRS